MPAKKVSKRPTKVKTESMKLAEALILRADCAKRLEQLKARLIKNAKVQEGERPAEDPIALLREYEDVSGRFERIIQRINRTNVATTLEGGESIADAIARRDVLRIRQAMYRDLAAAATVTQDRHTRSEVKFKGSVQVAQMQREADTVSKLHRELDGRIQEANWQTDLKE